MKSFSSEICQELGNYVYRLVDPRNAETFYVGKGVNNRVFAHISGAVQATEEEDEVSLKLARIRSIHLAGLEVMHVIHRHRIADASVFEVEAALIDAFPGLANVQGGHGSSDRGPMHAEEIRAKYGLPETQRASGHKLLLINVNRSSEDPQVLSYYESVRYAWRLDAAKARKMDYVLAVRRGVVLDAFVADAWLVATVTNFPSLSGDAPTRWGFHGREAPEAVRRLYRNTRLPDAITHVQNPIRYWH